MQLRALRKEAIESLKDVGVEAAGVCVDWLLGDVLKMTRTEIIVHSTVEVTSAAEDIVRSGLVRRATGEPIQYIVGWTEFYGLRLEVDNRALIPRPETELLVDEVLRLTEGVPGCRVLDVGTGSGCIALAVKSQRPDGQIVACDISEDALALARTNSAQLDLPVTFLLADVEKGQSMAAVGYGFDVMVSNPPYIPTRELAALPKEIIQHEPVEALDAGLDPLRYYRALIDRASETVVNGGRLVAEVHSDYGSQVAVLARRKGLSDVRLSADLAGLPRMVVATVGHGRDLSRSSVDRES
ncbi:MAG: peptide chain release factor N(5)-glutamine methyltransferase [Rhodothermales bacterium]|nr:peptide chain release factor N(5)-glutamine methyltransferase [Rhodothermales bacterium]